MIYQDLRKMSKSVSKSKPKIWLFIMLGILIYLLSSSFFRTESGFLYLYDNVLTGKLDVYQKPGIHFIIPFSPVTRYKQVWIVDFGTGFAGQQIRRHKAQITLRFADNYTATIPATFRYKLPSTPGRLERIHRDFTTPEKLVDALLIPLSRDVMVMTATQYTGEEFIQGGLNQFRVSLEDQLQNGIYQTDRQLEEVRTRLRDTTIFSGSSQQKSTSLKIWKTVPVKGADGKIARLEKKSLVEYGIDVIQVTLGVPVPEPELEQLLAAKKRFDRVANDKMDELALVQYQKQIQTANIDKERQIQTAQIEKNKSIETAEKEKQLTLDKYDEKIKLAKKAEELALTQKQLEIVEARLTIKKAQEKEELAIKVFLAKSENEEKLAIDLAIIKAQKEEELLVAEAEQKIQLTHKARELAVVQVDNEIKRAEIEEKLALELATIKAKTEEEMHIAQANLDIQKANLEAVKFEALVIREKGLAETDILKARYEARLPDMYLAEIQKEIAAIIYPNLLGMNVTMPHNVIMSGEQDNKLQTNLDVLSSFATLGVMEGLEKKALEEVTP